MTAILPKRANRGADLALRHIGQPISLADPGATIFCERDPGRHFLKLLSGAARLLRYDEDGQRHLMAFLFPGEVAERPLAGRHRFNLEAICACSYILEEADRILSRLELDTPLAGGIDHLAERAILLSCKNIPGRVARFLLMIAPRLQQSGELLHFPVPQTDIAAYLATTPETVCRTFRRLREQRLIDQHGHEHLRILDMDGLARASRGQR